MNRHFNTYGFSTFQHAIDLGLVVMTDMYSEIPGSSHNVVIVGYHTDGNLIYMDPEKGCLWEADQSKFNLNYAISISSCK